MSRTKRYPSGLTREQVAANIVGHILYDLHSRNGFRDEFEALDGDVYTFIRDKMRVMVVEELAEADVRQPKDEG